MAVIETERLTKHYGKHRGIVDVDLTVAPGEIFGFLGPNGAGKTTTIRLLLDLIRPTSGRARVFGIESTVDPVAIHRRIGYLPGEFALFDRLTGGQTVEYYGNLRGGVDRRRQAELMARFDLDPSRRFREYSKGNKQKVGLVIALQHQPELLILDEPTAGLDPKQIIETRQLIKQLGGDHTVILSTHILPEVSQTCQRVVIINKGRVVAIDTPDNLTSRLRGSETMYVQIDAGANGAVQDALAAVPGVTHVAQTESRGTVASYEVNSDSGRDIRRELSAAVVNRGWGLLELRPLRMSLEEVFLHLTTEEAPHE